MLNRLKNYNNITFIIFLIFFLGFSVYLFSYHLEEKMYLLQQEIHKIDQQTLFFKKKNNQLISQRTSLLDNINSYLTLQTNIAENKTENIKKMLSENSKYNELLAILPLSEIVNIQQTNYIKKINTDMINFKSQANFIWHSINQLTSESFNNHNFVIGNLKDHSLKTTLSNDIATLLKKEQPIFSAISISDKDINNFSLSTESVKQFFPLLQSQQEKNKYYLYSVINSLRKQLYMVQIVFFVFMGCLLLLLAFVIFKKKKLLDYSAQQINIIDNNTDLNQLESPIKTTADNVLDFVNTMNNSLSKHINLHFDSDIIDNLPSDIKDNFIHIIEQYIKFSFVYSFDLRDFGDIVASIHNIEGNTKLIFKNNGKILSMYDIKNKVKQQYGVTDSAFSGKSEQQILSLIFKPGFNFLPQQINSDYTVNLSYVTELIKQYNAQLSIKNQENHGVEFVILFPAQTTL